MEPVNLNLRVSMKCWLKRSGSIARAMIERANGSLPRCGSPHLFHEGWPGWVYFQSAMDHQDPIRQDGASADLEPETDEAWGIHAQKPLPDPGGDEAAALARFRETLKRFVDHQGDYQPSPFFGIVSRADSQELNLIHCRHHLGI